MKKEGEMVFNAFGNEEASRVVSANEGKICSNCILPESVPGISFDSKGVCNFCRDYQNKEASIPKNCDALECEMLSILRVNPRRHPYDCICLYSGGKDSTYMLDQLVNKHKLRVLAFTFDNWFIPRETYENINKVLSKTDCDHLIYKPSWGLNKTIFRAGFNDAWCLDRAKELSYLIGHACWPCFVQIALHAIKFAVDKNIPNIVVGTTPGQIRQKKYNLVSKYGDMADVNQAMIQPMIRLLKATNQTAALRSLDMPFFKKLKVLGIRLVSFYEYVSYNEQLAIETAQNKFGWEKPANTDSCSSNCQLNVLGIEIHRKKYGMSPYVIPLARDVREGVVKREDAIVAIAEKPNEALAKSIAERFEIKI